MACDLCLILPTSECKSPSQLLHNTNGDLMEAAKNSIGIALKTMTGIPILPLFLGISVLESITWLCCSTIHQLGLQAGHDTDVDSEVEPPSKVGYHHVCWTSLTVGPWK